jgi:hypothetical protein
MRMLEMNFFRAPPVRDVVERNVNHLGRSVIDPRDAVVIETDMTVG